MKTCTEHHTVWLLLFNITCSIFAFSHFLMLLFGLSVNIKWQWFESLLHACVDTVFGLTETHWVWHLEIGERLHAAPLFIHLCMPLISHCPKPFCHSEWLFMDSWRGKEGGESATLILLAKKNVTCSALSAIMSQCSLQETEVTLGGKSNTASVNVSSVGHLLYLSYAWDAFKLHRAFSCEHG